MKAASRPAPTPDAAHESIPRVVCPEVIAHGAAETAQPATAIVLAGGNSSRMGVDKALLPLRGRPLIENVVERLRPHFRQVLIAANDKDKFAFLELDVVPDEVGGAGPLMALVSALRVSAHDVNFVVGCDMPAIDIGFVSMLLREVEGYDCVVPVKDDARFEPLLAVYRRRILPAADAVLASGRRRMVHLLERCNVKYVALERNDWARNINTFDDYRTLVATNAEETIRAGRAAL